MGDPGMLPRALGRPGLTASEDEEPLRCHSAKLQQVFWEDDHSTSSGSNPSTPELTIQRSISDPIIGSPNAVTLDLRRSHSWPALASPELRATTEDILLAPFHDKARARLRSVEEAAQGPGISRLTFAMWVAFGASGWWSTNAVTAQLPLLTEVLPERNKLGNQLSAVTQWGNLFLLFYMLLRRRCRIETEVVICSMMTLGIVALVGCALFWDCTAFGRSVPLLALTTIAGGVGCTSGVTYWTFLLLYPPRCTIPASVGMSLGGVVANILVACQLCGRGGEGPRFSISAFFMAAAAIQVLGMVCFMLVRARGRAYADDFGDLPELGRPLVAEDELEGRPGSPEEAVEEEEKDDLRQGVRTAFCCLNFLVRGVSYLMPTLMPYVAAAYPSLKTELLFSMLLGQQAGETTGRALVPSPGAAMAVGGLAILVFCGFVAAALNPLALTRVLPELVARVLIPAACTFFFLSYGMIETTIFKWIRGLSKRTRVVEDLSAMTGSCGQLGSLASTFVVFLCLELHWS